MAKKEEQKKESKYKVEDVATQTAPVISDGENYLSEQQALAKILNELDEIKAYIK